MTTVKQLIAFLNTLDQDMEVEVLTRFDNPYGEDTYEISAVDLDNTVLWDFTKTTHYCHTEFQNRKFVVLKG